MTAYNLYKLNIRLREGNLTSGDNIALIYANLETSFKTDQRKIKILTDYLKPDNQIPVFDNNKPCVNLTVSGISKNYVKTEYQSEIPEENIHELHKNKN